MFDTQTFHTIKSIISKHIEWDKYHAFIFGSRAEGSARRWSDIDIGIEGKEKIPEATINEIKGEFEESNLPYTVDVVDFSTVSERFKTEAKKSIIPIN